MEADQISMIKKTASARKILVWRNLQSPDTHKIGYFETFLSGIVRYLVGIHCGQLWVARGPFPDINGLQRVTLAMFESIAARNPTGKLITEPKNHLT